jgi:hypothetical protein
MKILPIDSLKGTRLFWSKEANIYQLEYTFGGRMTKLPKKRSYFYRPEHIANQELWNEVKVGNDVLTMEDIKSAQELEQYRQMRKGSMDKGQRKHKYK